MFMTEAIFRRTLEWCARLNDRLDDKRAELAITGLGESLLHPHIVHFLKLAREALPANPITIATNGIALTDDLAKAIAPYRPRLYISLHRPERAKGAIEIAKKYGLFEMVNCAAATSSFDWAGLLDWHVSAPRSICEFLRSGWGMVLVDGSIVVCCLDAVGTSKIGHVDDPIESLTKPGTGLKPWGDDKIGCAACHNLVP